MQVKMEIGQQEVTTLKQELEQMRITRVEKWELVKEEDTTRRQEIQLAFADLEAKENQLKDHIEEAKSWSQVVSGSSNKQKEIIEKQIKIQIKEEQDKWGKVANIIIKALRDFGENERTNILARDFLKDELK